MTAPERAPGETTVAIARELRRELHRDPEVGLELPRTQRRVLEALAPLNLPTILGTRSSSIVVVVRGTAAGRGARPAVLLRADMDGLPLSESTGLPSASTNGAMHACGHDLHTAMLVGTALELVSRPDRLSGDVVLAFEAGEEGMNGARAMLSDGALEAAGEIPVAAFGLHVRSNALPPGVFGTRSGALTATGTTVRIDLIGRGGHGSSPHEAVDPVPALADVLTMTQVALARSVDAFRPVVFSPGVVRAGSRRNVVPESAMIDATLRTFDPETRDGALAVIERVVAGAAQAHGVQATLSVTPGYPSVVVDDSEHRFAVALVEELFGSEAHLVMPHPVAMTEDFSRIAEVIPSFFAFLGAAPVGTTWRGADANHSSGAVFDDAVIDRGIALQTAWARRRLEYASRSASGEHPERRAAQEEDTP